MLQKLNNFIYPLLIVLLVVIGYQCTRNQKLVKDIDRSHNLLEACLTPFAAPKTS